MNLDEISISKAAEHNLKDVSIKIPKNTLTVITGPSGSGKSSLAFDTIYVEGQRRYIESLSSYARQFLGQYRPPVVESITGLSPAIAIDQKTSSRSPRSTVGTTTEIFDYLRILYARAGTLYCPETGQLIKKYTVTQIVNSFKDAKEKTKLHILAPIFFENIQELQSEISKLESLGLSRVRINNKITRLDEIKNLKKCKTFEVVIDRLLIKPQIQKRLADSIESALKQGNGQVIILKGDQEEVFNFSELNISPSTGEIFPDLEPALFSFNSPIGACENCNGLGESQVFDNKLMVLDDSLSIEQGALIPISKKSGFLYKMANKVIIDEKIDIHLPFKKLSKKHLDLLFFGSTKVYTYSFTSKNSHFKFSKKFPGVVPWLESRYHETNSERKRKELESFMHISLCPECKGQRLNRIALATKIDDCNIMDISHLSIKNALIFISQISFEGEKKIIAHKLLKEIKSRLNFLNDIGLDYLSLSRASSTLSGGEGQRIRLATQIGSGLSGVLYVLDEPSIGLHQKDNSKLIKTLKSLRDLGNTVLVVEHDEETMLACDYLIDMGPGAGEHGGQIVAHGKVAKVLKNKKSLTAKYLNKSRQIDIPTSRQQASSWIELIGAKKNNLQNVSIKIPLNVMTCITGVSGSGKSTLIHNVLIPAMRQYLTKNSSSIARPNYKSISGVDKIDSIIELDQSPIGRTPKSNPATYSGLFDSIRELYSHLPESQIRGYRPGRFSFNVKGGRCEECEGNGVKKIEMHFLPDVYVECVECLGKRYNRETLGVLYKGKTIADILQMSIEEAHQFFINHPKLSRILNVLNKVGLGYMKLGQPATTLSGGEAQRLKLSKELARRPKGHCFYVLDEPTTGLHFEDIKILLEAIFNLYQKGHSVLVIEHNLDVIKCADYVIDLGPDGGDKGGMVIASGTPDEVAKVKKSYTGKFLQKILKK